MTIQTIEIQKNVLKELGQNPDNTVLQARALRWLNKSLDKLQGYIPDVEFLQTSEMTITLVASQATYALPIDFFYIGQIRIDEESLILNQHTKDGFDRLHPDPANEDEDVPSDFTLEFDRVNGRHILRLAPIPDDAYVMHATIRRWHPALTGSQNIQYDKLETTLEEGGIYHGSLSIYGDQEYIQLRAEYKSNWLEAVQNLQQPLNMQKPRPIRIPTQLKKMEW